MNRNRIFQLFFNVPDGTGPGGAPSGAPASTPSPAPTTPSAAPAGTPASGMPGGGGAPAAAAGANPTGGSAPSEPDRSNWIPPYRFNELSQRAATLEANYNSMMQRMRVLMGVAEPPNPEHGRIQEAMFQVFPWLRNVHQNPQLLDRLLHMTASGTFDQFGATGDAMWTRHAADMSRYGVDQLAKVMGKTSKDLGQAGLRRIARELQSYISEDQTGERQRRYEMGDQTLVDEMLTELTGFYVQPAQVQQAVQGAVQVARARSLPSSGPRTGPPPPTVVQQQGQPGQPRFASKKERFAAMRQDFTAAQAQ